ncbi:hypothetical protein D6829_01365 [Candidatus Pacearchaeota archaeon]|nr:MAG: hypothetical protein D6829_01365 [Candidatus Pacearchaeota archaeon]
MKVLKEFKNPFLNRKEILVEIESAVTPKKEEIVSKFGTPDVVVIKKIKTAFGKKKFLADIVVYDSPKDREDIEVVPNKIRKKLEEERKAKESEEKREETKEEETKVEDGDKVEG